VIQIFILDIYSWELIVIKLILNNNKFKYIKKHILGTQTTY
jgi:hypothetical protein